MFGPFINFSTRILFPCLIVLAATQASALAQSGACCLGNATCISTNAAGCAAVTGDFIGAGSDCLTTQCLGACCQAGLLCNEIARDACVGSFQGPNSTCETHCPMMAGTCITYQGQIKEGGIPVADTGDFRFALHDTAIGGIPLGTSAQMDDVSITNGLFTADIDFGADVFDGNARYLEVAVRVPHDPTDALPFTILSPRQIIASTPMALQTRGIHVEDNGNVGIGTSNPATLLSVQGGGLQVFDSANQGIALATNDFSLTNAFNEDPVYQYNFSNDRHTFFTAGSARMVLDNVGRVGIGTSTPEAKLHVFAGSAGVVTAHFDSNLVVEGNGNSYLSLLTPNANESGILFGSPVNVANGGIIFNDGGTPNGLVFLTAGGQDRMALSSVGDLSFDGSLNMVAGQSIFANGQLTFGGANLVLRLGDNTADLVAVPARRVFMSDTVTIADGDQTLFFTDAGVTTSNFLRWDDPPFTFTTCGSIGAVASAFRWHIGDNINSAWVFTNGTDATPDFEMIIDDTGNVEIDGSLTQNGACDVAEAFLGPEGLSAGTVVVLDPATAEGVVAASRAYQSGIVGVVSTMPGILMGGPTANAYPAALEMRQLRAALQMTDTERALYEELESLHESPDDAAAAPRSPRAAAIQEELKALDAGRAELAARKDELEAQFDNWRRGNVHVALVGRVPVRVVGPVRAGDYLTASDTPGVAMAMQQAGPTLGVAMQDFSGGGEGSVVALIQPGWYGATAEPVRAADAFTTELLRENAELEARLAAVQHKVGEQQRMISQWEARLELLEARLANPLQP